MALDLSVYAPPANQTGTGAIVTTITGGVLAGLALFQQTKLEKERLRLEARTPPFLPPGTSVPGRPPAGSQNDTMRTVLYVVAGVAIVGGLIFLAVKA